MNHSWHDRALSAHIETLDQSACDHSAHTVRGAQGEPEYSYAIHVGGHLDSFWLDAYDQLTVTNLPDGTALLAGPLPDQAALYGVLARLQALCIPLLGIHRAVPPSADAVSLGAIDEEHRGAQASNSV